MMAVANLYLRQPEEPQSKKQELERDEKIENCSFYSRRTYSLCDTSEKYIYKTCLWTTDHDWCKYL